MCNSSCQFEYLAIIEISESSFELNIVKFPELGSICSDIIECQQEMSECSKMIQKETILKQMFSINTKIDNLISKIDNTLQENDIFVSVQPKENELEFLKNFDDLQIKLEELKIKAINVIYLISKLLTHSQYFLLFLIVQVLVMNTI